MDTAAKSEAIRRRKQEYALSLAVLGLAGAGIVALATRASSPVDPRLLVKPMLAMFGLTAAVLLFLFVWRNVFIATGRASANFYLDYQSNPPAEWIERPSRVFNNLMQAPTLFYVVALLMMVTPWADGVEVELAWIFVGLRTLHAAIYLALNRLLWRGASYALSVVALCAMWARYALAAPLI